MIKVIMARKGTDERVEMETESIKITYLVGLNDLAENVISGTGHDEGYGTGRVMIYARRGEKERKKREERCGQLVVGCEQ